MPLYRADFTYFTEEGSITPLFGKCSFKTMERDLVRILSEAERQAKKDLQEKGITPTKIEVGGMDIYPDLEGRPIIESFPTEAPKKGKLRLKRGT